MDKEMEMFADQAAENVQNQIALAKKTIEYLKNNGS